MVLVAALVALVGTAPAITVENIKSGETIRYPVALLRGTTSSKSVRVEDFDNKGLDGSNDAQVQGGRFVVLVQLKPGVNHLRLSAGDEQQGFLLNYKPMTTPYKVNVIYLTAEDGDTKYITQRPDDPQNFRAKLSTAAKIMQTFCAEDLNQEGFGRKTFNLEFDKEGNVVVHVLHYPKPADDLRKLSGNDLWSMFWKWLPPYAPMDVNKNMVIMSFSDIDPVTHKSRGHTALGGDGLGLFGSASMFSWPSSIRDVAKVFLSTESINKTKVWDDSVGRSVVWGLASTTIGATMHEMGHTFGLPHTADLRSIMWRGFDGFNRLFTEIEPPSARKATAKIIEPGDLPYWSPFFAAQLSESAWFQMDGPRFDTTSKPTIRFDLSSNEAIIKAPHGLAMVGYSVWAESRDGASSFEMLNGTKEARLNLAEIRKKLSASEKAEIMVIAFDKEHNKVNRRTGE